MPFFYLTVIGKIVLFFLSIVTIGIMIIIDNKQSPPLFAQAYLTLQKPTSSYVKRGGGQEGYVLRRK